MNTRIFSASLFCVAVLCSAVPASAAMRTAIAGRLQQARFWEFKGSLALAMERLRAAEAVPNQTDEEKDAVAHLKAEVMYTYSKSSQSGFGTREDNAFPYIPPPNAGQAPPSQVPNEPHPY